MSSTVAATTSQVQTSASGATYLTGTVSGLDTESLIEAGVNAMLVPKQRLEDEITTNTNKISSYQDLQTQAQALQATLNVLQSTTTGDATNALTAKEVTYLSSSSTAPTNLLNATTTGTAQTGSHTVIVTSLATALTVTSAEQTAGASAALGYNGTFDIGEAGKTASTITVTSSTTLQQLADSINATTSTSGVKADILQAGDGGAKLVISGNDTATAVNVSNVTGDNVLQNIGLTNSSNSFVNVSQPAAQAQFSVDGTTIYSNTNQITNVLSGLTLNLTNADPNTTVTVTVGNNTDGVTSAINNFVAAYNNFHAALAAYQEIGSDGTVSPTAYLYDDSLTTSLAHSVSSTLTDNYGASSNVYQSLGSLGITVDENNELTVDTATLSSALTNNFSSVQAMFSTTNGIPGFADTMYSLLDSYAADSTGSLATAITNLESDDTNYTSQAADIQTNADAYQQTLITKYANLETAMSQANITKQQVQAILNGSSGNNNNN